MAFLLRSNKKAEEKADKNVFFTDCERSRPRAVSQQRHPRHRARRYRSPTVWRLSDEERVFVGFFKWRRLAVIAWSSGERGRHRRESLRRRPPGYWQSGRRT
jgi:hypothetical protein